MARIVYCHPSQSRFEYHIFTDLDFWDARRLLRDIVVVKRNFGKVIPGDEFPTQVAANDLRRSVIREIERRLRIAIPSPPRHVVVRSMIYSGSFEFDPLKYFPNRWSRSRMLYFTLHRLPLQQSALCNPYQTAHLSWVDGKIRVTRVQREAKSDPVIRTFNDARRSLMVPSCF